jgi:hypothetical protein
VLLYAGQFDERAAKGLDSILAEAGKYGIKVTLVLLNQCEYAGEGCAVGAVLGCC